MPRQKTTAPATPRAKAKRRSVTNRLTALEVRMDLVERNVVERLDKFEKNIVESLARFGSEEYKGRNIFRAATLGLGILILAVLLARMYGWLGN